MGGTLRDLCPPTFREACWRTGRAARIAEQRQVQLAEARICCALEREEGFA